MPVGYQQDTTADGMIARSDPQQALPSSEGLATDGFSAEASADRLAQMQQRLKELGASYYLLESWGNRGEYYRFQCRMPLGRGRGAFRCFEATDSNALQAMARVLDRIEAWKSQSR